MSHSMLETMMVCSTGNLSQETCDSGGDYPRTTPLDVRTTPHEFGFICRIPENNDGLPEDLKTVLDYARTLGAQWVNFDRDADTIEGLPSYDW